VKSDTQRREAARRRLPGLTVKDGYTSHPFDIENRTRTSGLVAGRYLKSGHLHDRHATAYFGVAPSVLKSLLRRWRATGPAGPIEQFMFIDVGAGMGRALLLAAEMPFRKAIGIELNPTLVGIARRNMSSWRARGRTRTATRIVCCDAVQFNYPAAPCLLFLFNPFGATVMRRMLARLTSIFANHPGGLDLLYVNNEQEQVLERTSGFTRLFAGQVRRSRADAIADHAIMANQPDGEYASSNYEDCSIWRWVGEKPFRE
jgi:SAM-dependent methyltransferase